jgi:hypothetical protein
MAIPVTPFVTTRVDTRWWPESIPAQASPVDPGARQVIVAILKAALMAARTQLT